MNILCIDTCQQGLALAIKTDSNWITHVDEDYRTQATNLLPCLLYTSPSPRDRG